MFTAVSFKSLTVSAENKGIGVFVTVKIVYTDTLESGCCKALVTAEAEVNCIVAMGENPPPDGQIPIPTQSYRSY